MQADDESRHPIGAAFVTGPVPARSAEQPADRTSSDLTAPERRGQSGFGRAVMTNARVDAGGRCRYTFCIVGRFCCAILVVLHHACVCCAFVCPGTRENEPIEPIEAIEVSACGGCCEEQVVQKQSCCASRCEGANPLSRESGHGAPMRCCLSASQPLSPPPVYPNVIELDAGQFEFAGPLSFTDLAGWIEIVRAAHHPAWHPPDVQASLCVWLN